MSGIWSFLIIVLLLPPRYSYTDRGRASRRTAPGDGQWCEDNNTGAFIAPSITMYRGGRSSTAMVGKMQRATAYPACGLVGTNGTLDSMDKHMALNSVTSAL